MLKPYQEILREIKKNNITTQDSLNKLKIKITKKYKLPKIPTNIEILCNIKESQIKKFKKILTTKPVRTISGVTVIAIMTQPFKCPHKQGPCIYCPGGPKSFFGTVPQSYTGKEPATRRAIRNLYDPYLQVMNRLEQYILLNQDISKVELIIMGGTFPSFPQNYQNYFIKYAFKALNDFSKFFFKNKKLNIKKFKNFFELPHGINEIERIEKIKNKLLKLKSSCSLKKEQLKNETSNVRCVALCIETRPDYAKKQHINQMLKLGTTRVELGVQTLSNKILKKIRRGHTVEEIISTTQLLKDSFLKVGYHMMPGLPFSTTSDDKKMFKELFTNPNFKPDALKIYPCMVMPGTLLYNLWQQKKFKPLTTTKAASLIAECKKQIPIYCRIIRIQRDIPSTSIAAGVSITNLRQKIQELMKKKKITCNCIRCREPRGRNISWKHVKILRFDYEASNGIEIFLSAEDTKNNILIGFCRIRIPYKPFRKEITKNSAGIRELHVYGTATPLEKPGEIQHKGYGKKLLNEAENILKNEFKIKKLLIISGIGVKEYFKKLGYKKDGVYMSKKL